MAPAHERTKNTLFTVLLVFEGWGNDGESLSLMLYALFVVCSLLIFAASPSFTGDASVSAVSGVGEVKSRVGEMASSGSLCISINDPRRCSLCVAVVVVVVTVVAVGKGGISSWGWLSNTSVRAAVFAFTVAPETLEPQEGGRRRGGLGGGRMSGSKGEGKDRDGVAAEAGGEDKGGSAMGYLKEGPEKRRKRSEEEGTDGDCLNAIGRDAGEEIQMTRTLRNEGISRRTGHLVRFICRPIHSSPLSVPVAGSARDPYDPSIHTAIWATHTQSTPPVHPI